MKRILVLVLVLILERSDQSKRSAQQDEASSNKIVTKDG